MTDKNSLRATDYQALAEFRYQIRRFLRFSEEASRQAGLEPQHHQLMLAVKGAPENIEPTIGYLAECLQIQHHSAVELVDRLVKRGLIQRIRGEEDRREVHVKLTAKGERLLKDLTLYHRNELRTAAPALVGTLKKMMTTAGGNHKAPARKRTMAARMESHTAR
jgi:DNA-binding MarR family transcriptional regulator